jgi:hypothetical protein
MSETVYKWLKGRESLHGCGFRYRLGAWKPAIVGELEPCRNAYHGCSVEHLSGRIATDLFVVESQSEWLDGEDKLYTRGPVRIVEHLRGWSERTALLFAADCAERALLREREAGREPDERSWRAVEVATRYALGTATRDAARDAYHDAAYAPPVVARAYSDQRASYVAYASACAAAYAARAAAWPVAKPSSVTTCVGLARVSSDDAAAERLWQGERILDYAYERIG